MSWGGSGAFSTTSVVPLLETTGSRVGCSVAFVAICILGGGVGVIDCASVVLGEGSAHRREGDMGGLDRVDGWMLPVGPKGSWGVKSTPGASPERGNATVVCDEP